MNRDQILREIEAEIDRLQRARELFSAPAAATTGPRNGRKTRRRRARRTGSAAVKVSTGSRAAKKPARARKRRTISAEGRARIAAAQKRRWAKQKQSSSQS